MAGAKKSPYTFHASTQCYKCANLDNDSGGFYCMIHPCNFRVPPCPYYAGRESNNRTLTPIEKEEYEKLVKNSRQMRLDDY